MSQTVVLNNNDVKIWYCQLTYPDSRPGNHDLSLPIDRVEGNPSSQPWVDDDTAASALRNMTTSLAGLPSVPTAPGNNVPLFDMVANVVSFKKQLLAGSFTALLSVTLDKETSFGVPGRISVGATRENVYREAGWCWAEGVAAVPSSADSSLHNTLIAAGLQQELTDKGFTRVDLGQRAVASKVGAQASVGSTCVAAYVTDPHHLRVEVQSMGGLAAAQQYNLRDPTPRDHSVVTLVTVVVVF